MAGLATENGDVRQYVSWARDLLRLCAMGSLQTYRRKRDFALTAEPKGVIGADGRRAFVVQKHAARTLHYDFRLEHEGVLLSWAVPKGPSADPAVKRLAMRVEDHPVDYGDFEGTIPEGQYGAGAVLVWDRGTWQPDGDVRKMLAKGQVRFHLHGEKLRGGFVLFRLGKQDKQGRERWLLVKRNDEAAERGTADSLLVRKPASVLSGLAIEELESEPAKPKRVETRRDDSVPEGSLPRGAKGTAMPEWVSPQLALLTEHPPTGSEWFHEVKLDGYRMLARLYDGAWRLLSRRGNDWTSRLPSVAAAFAEPGVKNAIIDGEVVVFDERGVTDFQGLQNSLDASKDEPCVYVAFDLLFLEGDDLRSLPLRDRKATLQRLFSNVSHRRLRFSEHVIGHGPQFFENACKLGLEGIICKRADAPYTSRRTNAWLKCKCSQRQEFVVGGYTDPAGSRSHFGALLLGLFTDEGLVYAGKVGTGFTAQSLRDVARRMKPLRRDDCLEGLLGLVQVGGLEIHTWGCCNSNLECPDRLTFDLDPDQDLPWDRVVEAALLVKRQLSRLGLHAFVKTTGGKGLHVVTPIVPAVPWGTAKAFSKSVVEAIAKSKPSQYLTTMTKKKRRGRVFLDYLRNGKGATAVCAYSTRAKPGAPVATPITWEELEAGARPERFDVNSMAARMAALPGDPWAALDAHAVRLTDDLLRQAAN